MDRRLIPWALVAGVLLGFAGGPGAVAGGFGLLGLYLWAIRRNRHDAALAALNPDPAPAPSYVATIYFLVEDCHRGHDRGLVTFLDGWMLFEGRRSRFSVRAVDVRDARPDGGDIEILLKADRRSMIVTAFHEAFKERFYAWCRASERVDGEPTLPPLGI